MNNITFIGILAVELVASANVAWAQSADPIARDIASSAGLLCDGKVSCLTQGEHPVFDYDGDGYRDILLAGHGGAPWVLMHNDGNDTFTKAFEFLKTDRHGCVAADVGSPGGGLPDGRPDVYCVTGACEGKCTASWPNHLFLQTPEHSFVEEGVAWGVADPHGRGRVPLVLDLNRDGLPDLAVVNQAPSLVGSPNRLFQNIGGRFVEVAGSPFNTETNSKCGKAADLDGDGWTDIAICSERTAGVRIMTFKNVNGELQDITAHTAYKGLRVVEFDVADVNGDRRPDLLILEPTRFSVWLNVNGTHPKMNYSRTLKLGRDLAVGDVNLDGKPDIYIVQGTNRSYMDFMLLNNGTGVAFRSIRIPQVLVGDGDVVTAIPNWGGSGRAAFLVSNGKWTVPGPYQLLVFSAH